MQEAEITNTAAKQFWYDVNKLLAGSRMLTEGEIETIVNTASADGLRVMTRAVPKEAGVNWIDLVYNFMTVYPCKMCAMEIFDEGFDERYIRDPLMNFERIRKNHPEHISSRPEGDYPINDIILEDIDAEMAKPA